MTERGCYVCVSRGREKRERERRKEREKREERERETERASCHLQIWLPPPLNGRAKIAEKWKANKPCINARIQEIMLHSYFPLLHISYVMCINILCGMRERES